MALSATAVHRDFGRPPLTPRNWAESWAYL